MQLVDELLARHANDMILSVYDQMNIVQAEKYRNKIVSANLLDPADQFARDLRKYV